VPPFEGIQLNAVSIKFCYNELPARLIRLCHPPDGSTNPKYKRVRINTLYVFIQEQNTPAFNWDMCCHLLLYLRLIIIHCCPTNLLLFREALLKGKAQYS
jgi:hypothetical protein